MLMQSSALDSADPLPKDNPNQRGRVYVITFFTMTKQLVAPLLCERTPLVCSDPCSPNYTVMATCHCSNRGGHVSLSRIWWGWAEARWVVELILAGVGLDVSDFLAAPGPARRRWSPSPRSGPTWSKANRWAWRVSHLLGCQLPLARGKNLWGELKHPQAAISRGLSSDLIWPGSSAHWGDQRMMLQENNFQPMTSLANAPLQDGPK